MFGTNFIEEPVEIRDEDGNVLWGVDKFGSIHNVPEVFNDGIFVEDSNGFAVWGVDEIGSFYDLPEEFRSFDRNGSVHNATETFNLANGGSVVIGEDDGFHGLFLFDDAGTLRGAVKFVGEEIFLFADNVRTEFVEAFGVFGEIIGAAEVSAGTITANEINVDQISATKITAETIDPLILEGLPVTSGETYQTGDVLVIDPDGTGTVRLSTIPQGHRVIGVVGPDATIDENGEILVIILGAHGPIRKDGTRVEAWVKVKAGGSPIAAGERLTASATAGVATAGDVDGSILGKALEPLGAGEEGQIRVFISLQ